MKKFVLFSLLLSIFFLGSCSHSSYILDNATSLDDEESEYILIDLRGEVLYPSVYKIKKGTLLNDLLRLAGGVKKDADLTNFSLVKSLEENEKIIIPSITSSGEVELLININKATTEELMTLPSVGESKAKAIIEYRNKNGNFKSIEEIKNVSGIGESLYAKIKEFITV